MARMSVNCTHEKRVHQRLTKAIKTYWSWQDKGITKMFWWSGWFRAFKLARDKIDKKIWDK